jgi:osmotically-inducible protein OsmY
MERTTKVAVVTDSEAEQAVEVGLLYDPRVGSYAIDVQVEHGKATLTGTVDNLKAKRAAGLDARNTMGIWKVDNRIKVRPKDEMADARIAENVRDALVWDPIVERYQISVWVRNRRVSLMGTVDTRFEKMHAEDVVSRVKGVASVDNKLVVEQAWAYKSDVEIKDDIESEYAWSPFVDGGDLTLRIDDGHVEVAGTVDTWHEYREAVENAFEGGAKTVRSYMRVMANDRMYDRRWSKPPSEVWPL